MLKRKSKGRENFGFRSIDVEAIDRINFGVIAILVFERLNYKMEAEAVEAALKSLPHP